MDRKVIIFFVIFNIVVFIYYCIHLYHVLTEFQEQIIDDPDDKEDNDEPPTDKSL